MPYFARVNKQTNIVEEVISATQLEIFNRDDFEDWVQTSYNRSIRKNYAGIGYTYDKERDAFIPPKPHSYSVLNEDMCVWEDPSPNPSTDTEFYVWNNETGEWELVEGHFQ